MKLDYTTQVSLIYSNTCMYNYSFRSEPTDCFCYATKQTYYSGEPDPETPQQLRWDSLQQLWTTENRWIFSQSAAS